jgi:hypothetical protein
VVRYFFHHGSSQSDLKYYINNVKINVCTSIATLYPFDPVNLEQTIYPIIQKTNCKYINCI